MAVVSVQLRIRAFKIETFLVCVCLKESTFLLVFEYLRSIVLSQMSHFIFKLNS